MTRRAAGTHRKSADWRNFPFVETLFVRAHKSAEATMLRCGDEGLSRSALGIACLAIALSFSAPASAGFLERLFGAFRHSHHAPRAPVVIQPFADPSGDLPMEREVGPAVGYCVRSCDGQYFPVHAQLGLSAAEACRSFCPAAKTQVYSGSSIDTAITANGGRYADLANAYLYRKQAVAGCSCNGRDTFGLARMDAKSDPTLRPGDIVATETGLVAFTGGRNQAAFTPVKVYHALSRRERGKISELKVSRSANVARTMVIPSTGIHETDGRSVQLEK
jgi:Protein of unknown function (DUF2865)